MRDPARISRIITKLTTVWSGVPDLRFWQLLSAIGYLDYTEISHYQPLLQDIFHYEDDRLEGCLDEYLLANNSDVPKTTNSITTVSW